MDRSKRITGEPLEREIPHDVLYMPAYARDDDVLLCVNRAGIVGLTPPDFHIRRYESYRYGVVHCVTRGKGCVTVRGREHRVGKGQLFVLGPGEPHEYASAADDPMGLCWVEFYGANSPDMLRQILSGGVVYGGAAFDATLTMLTQIIMRLEKPMQAAEISVLLYQLLVSLLKASGTLGSTDVARSGFSEILRYIDRNLGKKLTIQTLAEQFGYNPTYLARKFALEFGTPPAKYVLRQRIVRCHHLLLATNLSLEQIAAETGFYDASHFIAKFKQFEGVTPLMYRKQNRGLVPPEENQEELT